MARIHTVALSLLVVTLVLWVAAMAFTLARAEPQGPLVVAVFAIGTAETSVMAAVSRADGRLVAGTWWPWAFVVAGDDTTARRLYAAGARWVLPEAAFRQMMTGGCGFGFIESPQPYD